MRRVSPKWIHTNHSLLVRSKRCVSCSFLPSSLHILSLCLLASQASLLVFPSFFILQLLTFYSKIVTNVRFMPYSDTSCSLSASQSVSTVQDDNVVMPHACRGGKAKASAPWPDSNAQLLQEPPVGTTVAPPIDPATTQVDDDPDGLAALGVTGPAGMVRS